MLIDGLPPQSALHRAIDPEDAAWSQTDHLVAHAIDELRIGVWQRFGGPRNNMPEPFPRPGQKSRDQIRDELIVKRALEFKERQKKRLEASA